MKCNRCKNPLPSDGIVCKFCGALMDEKQIKEQNKYRDRNNEKITMLSEKYGHKNDIGYRAEKENKVLGLVIISVIIIFLIIMTLFLNL